MTPEASSFSIQTTTTRVMLLEAGGEVELGVAVGTAVGLGVGFGVGFGVGLAVATGVGFGVGAGVGLGVGADAVVGVGAAVASAFRIGAPAGVGAGVTTWAGVWRGCDGRLPGADAGPAAAVEGDADSVPAAEAAALATGVGWEFDAP